MKYLLGLLALVASPAWAQHNHAHHHHHDSSASHEAQIVITINPEARVSAVVAAPMPEPRQCSEVVELTVKIVNQGFVTAPLRAAIVGAARERAAIHMDAAKLSGGPEDVRHLHLISQTREPTEITVAFSIDDNLGDLGGRDRVHLLLRCIGGDRG